MISRIDRMILTAPRRRLAAEAWQRLFGAEVVREDRVAYVAAKRTLLRVGESEVELLEPDGIGIAAQHVSRSRTALFAIGLAVADLGAAQADLDARAVHHVRSGSQLWMSGEWTGVPALRAVLTQDERRPGAGLLQRIYEATHLHQDHSRSAQRIASTFRLDRKHFVPIRSEAYGYEGSLVLFHPDRLDRIETVTPFDRTKTMGRFFSRQGPCLYMAYAEAHDTAALRERLLELAPNEWTGPRDDKPDNLFVHPSALHGLLLGVSRESVAWTWSGHPERVRSAA